MSVLPPFQPGEVVVLLIMQSLRERLRLVKKPDVSLFRRSEFVLFLERSLGWSLVLNPKASTLKQESANLGDISVGGTISEVSEGGGGEGNLEVIFPILVGKPCGKSVTSNGSNAKPMAPTSAEPAGDRYPTL